MATVGISRLQPHFPVPAVLLRTLSDCHKPHNKAIYDTLATAGKFRLQPQIPVPAVLLRTFSDCHKPHNKAIYDTLATAGISRPKPYFPVPAVLLRTFSDCHKPHYYAICSAFSPAVSLSHETHQLFQRRNLKRHIATRRFAIARNAPTIPKAEFGAAHCRPPLRSCFPASSQAL